MQGPVVAELESRIADYCGAKHCVAVSSGTAALHVSCLAMGLRPGDAVMVPSFAWPSAANVTRLLGGTPVFVDSEPDTYNLACDHLRTQIERVLRNGGRPSMIVPVHQFGAVCDIEKVLALADQFSMSVLEDAACALASFRDGRHAGTFGQAGIFSFHPRKVLTTGEGGAIVTNDDALAQRCRGLRDHGNLEQVGLNYRMTDIQAAIGLVQMDKLTEILKKRSALLRTYVDLLGPQRGFSLPAYLSGDAKPLAGRITVQTLMVVLGAGVDREHVLVRMAELGVEAKPGSPAGHLMASYRREAADSDDPCPVATQLHQQGLALPLHPGMTQQDVHRCVEALNQSLGGET
jgi:dTDP-4-amino-4,6-dideoxygalactose transaminase